MHHLGPSPHIDHDRARIQLNPYKAGAQAKVLELLAHFSHFQNQTLDYHSLVYEEERRNIYSIITLAVVTHGVYVAKCLASAS